MKPPEPVGALLTLAHLLFLDNPLAHDLTIVGVPVISLYLCRLSLENPTHLPS
jgi:hypothetical protein